ncbi:molybdate ABC transporter substrate-binding protein [Bradyrhizobium sp.]|uniref:molybdate ABC transporter substrate-binding protein n=1 Tax=Bradyrhizobium sp. TaxID=376 RepID=UPI0025C121EB|nr:molybdate ABC transporter substrate-binding protein [Bradyrhizobium sp.]
MKARVIIAVATSLLLSSVADAAEIKVLASAAIRDAYLELLPQFEKATGNKVTAEWSGSPDIQKRIAAGEAADVVILGNSGTEELIRQGKLMPGSRANFAKSGAGIAVREGAPKPDISSADAVKKAVLAAKSVAYSAGASGAYIVSMFQKMGIADEVKAKTATVKPGEPVGAVVARGEAEIGFHQISELMPVKGIQYLGPLPPEIQNVTVFSGGVHSGTKEPDAATTLVRFLTSPAAMTIITKHHLEPG